MYMCSAECSGTVTPHMRPTAFAHCPAQFTTTAASIGPSAVSTPVARPSFTLMPVTLVLSKIFAPRMRAPFASACVTSAGFALPSLGSHNAPRRSPVAMIG